jgi:hypothetical protein
MRITDNNIYTENSIRTFTGKVFDLKILDPDSICIEDIAHSLAYTPRFGGHLPLPYSVAQHSVHVMEQCSPDLQLAALLHDASEAYIGDMPSPFKKLMPDYKKLEDNLMKVIAKKFGFEYPLHTEIKYADNALLNIEWEAYVNKSFKHSVWHPEEAKNIFIHHYNTLKH